MRHCYTVDSASKTLPYVSVIVAEVRERHRAWRDKGREHNALSREFGDRRATLKEEVRVHAKRLKECQEELLQLGIILKDHELGLVDFPAELDGRPILLCWEQSEPSVGFWHEVSGGYIGRQPVPPNLPEWPRLSAATAALE